MSDEVVIRVEKLGKRYRIRHEQRNGGTRYKALRGVLADAGKSAVRDPWSRSPMSAFDPVLSVFCFLNFCFCPASRTSARWNVPSQT
jgi:hypothetical protein